MLASQGLRSSARQATNALQHQKAAGQGAGTSRGIHIPSAVRVHPRIPNLGQTQKLFSQSRHIVAQFFNLLTAPGIRVPSPSTVGQSLQSVTRYPTIQQGFSLHVRNALSRSSQSHFLPRAPPAVPRGMSQVGLGNVRTFCSSRPIFQNLVENVPIAGRAIYESDLDLKKRKAKLSMRKSLKTRPAKKQGGKEMLKPRSRDFPTKEKMADPKSACMEAEIENYFAAPVVPKVTTSLLIPLAPTPATRVSLPENPGSLLPLPALASIHNSHELHSLRVSALFSRLDAANVWERGVQCSAFSHGGGSNGVCTMLKVEFIGWTKAEVRGVIGESGTGWCVLEEAQTNGGPFTDYDDDNLSDTSSVLSELFEDNRSASSVDLTIPSGFVDPAQSLLLPTLEFSSSFLASSSPSPSPQHSFVHLESNFDPWLDSESSSECELSRTSSWVNSPSITAMNGWESPANNGHDEPLRYHL